MSGRLGLNAETLRNWIRQAAVDDGQAEGVSTTAAKEILDLERKNAELEKTIDILKAATAFFVRESDPRQHSTSNLRCRFPLARNVDRAFGPRGCGHPALMLRTRWHRHFVD